MCSKILCFDSDTRLFTSKKQFCKIKQCCLKSSRKLQRLRASLLSHVDVISAINEERTESLAMW